MQGVQPTIAKGCATNVGMLGPYDQAKVVLAPLNWDHKKTTLM